jgi:hypothetical protein
MYAVPGASEFKLTLNSEIKVFFGATEPDHDLDIVTVTAPVQQASEVEKFTIGFSTADTGVTVNFNWGETMFTVPVALQ